MSTIQSRANVLIDIIQDLVLDFEQYVGSSPTKLELNEKNFMALKYYCDHNYCTYLGSPEENFQMILQAKFMGMKVVVVKGESDDYIEVNNKR